MHLNKREKGKITIFQNKWDLAVKFWSMHIHCSCLRKKKKMYIKFKHVFLNFEKGCWDGYFRRETLILNLVTLKALGAGISVPNSAQSNRCFKRRPNYGQLICFPNPYRAGYLSWQMQWPKSNWWLS